MWIARHEGFALLFEYPDYAKRWLGSVISGFGSQVGWISLVWLVMKLSGGATAVGVITLLYQLPQALLAPFAGVVLDRYSRTRVMAAANFTMAGIFTAIPTLALVFGAHALVITYVLILMGGMVVAFDTTGVGPLIADLIPQEKLSQANFLSQTVWQIAFIAGPGLGGLLIAVIGSKMLLYVDAATFLLLGFMMLSIHDANLASKRAEAPLQQLIDGAKYMWKTPALIALAALTFLFNLFYGPFEVLLPLLAKNNLGGSASLGLVWFTFAAGAFAGGIFFSSRQWPYRVAPSLAAIIVAWGAVSCAIGFATHSLWAMALWMLVGGLTYSPWGSLAPTAMQRLAPRELQGRVFGASSMMTIAGMPLGAWATGLLLPSAQPRTIFIICGLVTIVVGLWGFFWKSFRALDVDTA